VLTQSSFLLLAGLIHHRLQRIHILPVPALPLHHRYDLLDALAKLSGQAELLSHVQQFFLLFDPVVELLQLARPLRNHKFWLLLSLLFR
jgi:hypothetical protein